MIYPLPKEAEIQSIQSSGDHPHTHTITTEIQENVQKQLDHTALKEVPSKEIIRIWLLVNYGSIEKLLKINRKKIRTIEHPTGGKISQLIKISGWENEQGYILSSPQGFRSWIRWMYNIAEEKIDREGIKKFLIEKYGSIETLLAMNSASIRKIEYPNHGKIIKLGTLSGWKNSGTMTLHIPEAFYSWVRWLYETEK